MGDQGQLRIMRTASGLAHHNALRKKLLAVRVERLTFLDDHSLLTDKTGKGEEEPDWLPGGTRYVDLEGGAHWTPAKSFPASVTKGTTLRIDLAIAADAPDVDEVEGTISGKPSGEDPKKPDKPFHFEAPITLGGGGSGTVRVIVTAKGPLADEVFDCPARTIAWEVKVGERTYDLGTTGPHHLYVTYDQPNIGGQPMPTPFGPQPAPQEDGVTEQRMDAAVQLTEKMWRQAIQIDDPETGKKMERNDPHVLARILNAVVAGYTLTPDPAVPTQFNHPRYFNDQGGAWPIHKYAKQRAECQAIVRFVRATLMQIGCPGEARFVVVYAHADVDGGATALEDSLLPPDPDPSKYGPPEEPMNVVPGLHRNAMRRRTVDGVPRKQYLGLADRKVEVGEIIPGGTVFNSYEACLKFTHAGKTRYYGGGVPKAAFKGNDEVIKVFWGLVWYTSFPLGNGQSVARVEEIVHVYQEEGAT